ncbi:putative copper resistance protein D [Pseudorhodobacter antarcticus]|jgi:putative copper export protein|uniref:Putative copper resistance protein D n=1 Tax=Pseudorhodobacter antarcticus TaxID=1077947 RepID=A0A1H8MSG0_9RHOB|nr:CopD family protein [Pseudorhodobacter antarcticus]SEO20174.1 putative copper resistance protein D [Pseudorhodobacter antarcticus]
MILEYLQPDPSFLDGISVVVRAFHYAATIGAAGLAFFMIGYGHWLRPAEVTRLHRTLLGAIIAGLALSVGALALRVLVLTAGASMTDSAVWEAMMRSRIGDAFWMRWAGLVLLVAATMPWRAGPAIAAVGGVLVLGSYAAMGHSMLFQPRQEIAALVVLHLGVVAFWVGSLLPLLSVAQRPDGAETAALLHDWSRAATVAVVGMIASGVLLTWYLTVRLDLIFEAWHGWALAAKVMAVLAALALALSNRLRHTPALAQGQPGAGARLASSIRLEIILVLFAFYFAAEMVSVHPIDYGHRVQN